MNICASRSLPRRRRIARFLAVGLLNTAFGYSVFCVVLRLTGHAIVSVAVSTIIGALFNFKSTGVIVFGSSGHRLLGRFVAVYLVVFLANAAGLFALERCRIAPAFAQALLLPALAALSYRLNRDFVFDARIMDGAA